MKDWSNKTVIHANELEHWQRWKLSELFPVAHLEPSEAQALRLVQGKLSSSAVSMGKNEAPVTVTDDLGTPCPTHYHDAWQAGYDLGYQGGLVEGRALGLVLGRIEGQKNAQQSFDGVWQPLEQLTQSLCVYLNQVEEALAQDILALAVAMAQRLVAAHVAADPRALEPLLHQALALLPASLKEGCIRVNPHDLAVARTFLAEQRPETLWQWVEDPNIGRGGCVVEAPALRQDLTLEARLHQLMKALGGTEDRGQRTEDRGQRTEDRGQRTEDRGQRTIVR